VIGFEKGCDKLVLNLFAVRQGGARSPDTKRLHQDIDDINLVQSIQDNLQQRIVPWIVLLDLYLDGQIASGVEFAQQYKQKFENSLSQFSIMANRISLYLI